MFALLWRKIGHRELRNAHLGLVNFDLYYHKPRKSTKERSKFINNGVWHCEASEFLSLVAEPHFRQHSQKQTSD